MNRLPAILLATLLVATVPAQAQTTQGGPASGGSGGIVVGTTAITNNTPGDVLYDQNGVVGESSALTFNTSTGNLTSATISPVANTTALTISGGSITGSSTVSPGISVAGTLNTSGVVQGAVLNAVETYTQVGSGTTDISIQHGSNYFFATGNYPGSSTVGVLWLGSLSSLSTTNWILSYNGGTAQLNAASGGNVQLAIGSNNVLTSTSSAMSALVPLSIGSSADTTLSRLGAGSLMLSDSTTATKLTVSSTTDSLTSRTNYANAYLQAGINAGEFDLGSEHGGTGTALTKFSLNADGTAIFDYAKTTAATLTFPTTVNFTGAVQSGGSAGLTETCTIVATETLIFKAGILTGGTCTS